MISLQDAYSWLNYGDKSNLSPGNMLSLIQIEDKRIAEVDRKKIIRNLRDNCPNLPNPLERYEIKLALAKTSFSDDNLSFAKTDLEDAVMGYKDPSHRLGVASWMFGILLWKLLDNNTAFEQWTKARDIFSNLGGDSRKKLDLDKMNWYRNINDLIRLDLTLTAEEAHRNWLPKFQGGLNNLSEAGRLLVAEITKKIKNKEYSQAYDIAMKLEKISLNRVNSFETADALEFIGFSALQMGNPKEATKYFELATSRYTNYPHPYSISLWLLGIAQWQISDLTTKAIRNWTLAIEGFEGLARQYERNDDIAGWYLDNLNYMRRALEIKIREKI
jgi:tetratricopeptide (TPR) repeat protein